MVFVKSKLINLSGRTLLVVIHAEELDDQNKNRLTEELFSHSDAKKNELGKFSQKEIVFCGLSSI